MMDNEDYEIVGPEHDRLISAITKLDKTQHISEPTRNEPTNLNSEFNLIKRDKKLKIRNLTKLLEGTAHRVQISKKLKKSRDASKVLQKPLEKPQADRIKRATGYEQTKNKLGRWDPVVARSRTVDFVSFPLKTVTTKLQPTTDFLQKLVLKSPLEKELEKIDPVEKKMSEEEEANVYPMSYQEMLEQRQHIAKYRAQQSYRAAKAKRQSKIKSKKYHRILKKEKLKQQLKEFEELQKSNPEEALKKLEALEKTRALERHTLRHKNTGKWAKSKLVRAKYDKEVRQQLSEQLAVSRGLTEKIKESDSSDTEDNEVIPNITLSQDPYNPWMMNSEESNEFNFAYKKNAVKHTEDSESDSETKNTSESSLDRVGSNNPKIVNIPNQYESVSKKKKLKGLAYKITNSNNTNTISTSKWVVEPINSQNKEKSKQQDISSVFTALEQNISNKIEKKLNKLKRNLKNLETQRINNGNEEQNENEPVDNLEYLKFKKQRIRPVIDEKLIETNKKAADEDINSISPSEILSKSATVNEAALNIDPNRFIEVKPKFLNTALPESGNNLDQLDDDQVVPKVNIEEVFEEDDVVASFRQEKENEINKDQPNDIDLSLPGWGSWGGKGVKQNKRKKNRFILKSLPKVERRDENKGDIIIKEYKDPKLAQHKVTDIPFPFTSIKEYEASIRLPLGNTFIPENAHRKLIKPGVITKAGAIIEPMDEDELLVSRNRSFKNESIIKLLGQK